MIEIGAKCKINLSDVEYTITDVREKKIHLRVNEDTTRTLINYFVDLKEVENSEITVLNLSITEIYIIE